MVNRDSTLAALFDAPMKPGRVVWIGVRPARRDPVVPLQSAEAKAGKGLVGDRYRTSSNGARQVTLIQAESLSAIASYLQREPIDPALLRRNIVVQGMNLLALKNKRFMVGTALLEYSGECHPCSRMEEAFGAGGYNAVRGHGGITARIISDGLIRLDDSIYVVDSGPMREAVPAPSQLPLY
jgi:MOSC domain-containing protein YiiM